MTQFDTFRNFIAGPPGDSSLSSSGAWGGIFPAPIPGIQDPDIAATFGSSGDYQRHIVARKCADVIGAEPTLRFLSEACSTARDRKWNHDLPAFPDHPVLVASFGESLDMEVTREDSATKNPGLLAISSPNVTAEYLKTATSAWPIPDLYPLFPQEGLVAGIRIFFSGWNIPVDSRAPSLVESGTDFGADFSPDFGGEGGQAVVSFGGNASGFKVSFDPPPEYPVSFLKIFSFGPGKVEDPPRISATQMSMAMANVPNEHQWRFSWARKSIADPWVMFSVFCAAKFLASGMGGVK